MSQADAEDRRLSSKRPLCSFHLLRDHAQWRSSLRMRPELADVFSCPCDPMTRLLLRHEPILPWGLAGRLIAEVYQRDHARKSKKSPRLMRSGTGNPARSGGRHTTRRLCDSTPRVSGVNYQMTRRGSPRKHKAFQHDDDMMDDHLSTGPAAAMRNLIIAVIAALSVSACESTQEYPIAPNMVRLDVSPPAGPYVREATLRRAAELTLQNGYSAFRIEPIYVQAFDDFGVTIVMFHAGDPRAGGAFDAAAVLSNNAW
jgi:hypothetical protein